MRSARSLFLFALVAGVAGVVLVWSLATSTGNDAPVPEFGGIYVEGVVGAPSRVNPLFARENAADQTLTALVFAGLTRRDQHGSPFPDMAETWALSADGRTYTFTLRGGLFWHDGERVTSADVLFTYELLRSPELPVPPALAAILADAAVSAPDEHTVVISLPEPYSPLPAYLTLGILPRHLLEGLTVPELYDSFFNQQPVGSGPYRLVRLTPSEAELAANPLFHLDPPFIQRVELRFYRDAGALRQVYGTEELTAALMVGTSGDGTIAGPEGARTTLLPTGEITYVYLNLAQPIFQDARVRRALLLALDRDAILRDLPGGAAVRADSPIAPGSWAHTPSLMALEHDTGLAALLLEEAGWLLGPDGVRRKDGAPLAFTLTTNADPVRVAVAEHVAAAWASLGVQVNVAASGVSDLVRNRLEPRAYQAVLWAGVAAPDPDPYDAWHSSRATGRGGNLTGFADPRVDAILEEARTATQPRRRELYAEFQDLFAQEVPAIPLYASVAVYAQEGRLRGVKAAALHEPGDRFWQVQEWFLKTR